MPKRRRRKRAVKGPPEVVGGDVEEVAEGAEVRRSSPAPNPRAQPLKMYLNLMGSSLTWTWKKQ